MYRDYSEEVISNNACRIRFAESIIEQIKKDFSELNELNKRLESGNINSSDLDKIQQKIAWIKQEINILRKSDSNCLEGILWAGITEIENNAVKIEIRIKRQQMSHFF